MERFYFNFQKILFNFVFVYKFIQLRIVHFDNHNNQ